MAPHPITRQLLHPAAVLLAVLVFAACQATSPSLPSTTPSASPSSPSPEGRLERVADFPGIKDSAVTAVTAGGPGFVAVGYGGENRALVWRSVDGIDWTVVPNSPVFGDASMAGVAWNGERLVAVGRDLTSVDEELAAAWVSTDGLEWRRASGTASRTLR